MLFFIKYVHIFSAVQRSISSFLSCMATHIHRSLLIVYLRVYRRHPASTL